VSPFRGFGWAGTCYVAAVIVGGVVAVPIAWLFSPLPVHGLGLILYLGLFTQVAALLPISWRRGAQTLDTMPLVASSLLLPGLGVVLVAWLFKFSRREFGPDFPLWRALFNRAKVALEFGLPSLVIAHIHLAGVVETPVKSVLLSLASICIGYPLVARFFAYLERDTFVSVLASNVGAFTLQSNLVLGLGGGVLAMLLQLQAGYVMGIGLLGLLWTVRMNMRGIQRQQEQHVQTLEVLAQALDARDPMTERHSQRVSELAGRLGITMRLPGGEVDALRTAGLLHDIGKIGVRDSILSKRGPLTPDEWVAMKRHAAIGAEMVGAHSALESIGPWVRYHHERWDGSGYPDGLVGNDCPLGARILAVADSYDTITGPRVYRTASMSGSEAVDEISSLSGYLYDPDVVEALRQLHGLPNRAGAASSPGSSALRLFDGLRLVRTDRRFRGFTSGIGVSSLGDPLTTMAVVLTVYGISRSPLMVAGTYALKALATAVASNLLGGLSDRLDRRRVIVTTDLLRAAVLLSLPFGVRTQLWTIFPAVLMLAAAQAIGQSSREAALPDLVASSRLVSANAVVGATSMLANALGFPLAIALYTMGHGSTLLFVLDSVTFLIAAQITAHLRGNLGGGQRSSRVRGDLLHSFSLPHLGVPLAVAFGSAAFISMAQPTLVVLASSWGGRSGQAYGLLETVVTVGIIVGNVVLIFLGATVNRRLVVVGLIVMGGLSICVALSPSLLLSAALLMGASAGNALYTIGNRSLLQNLAPPASRSAVMATRFTTVQVASVIGSAAGGIIAMRVGAFAVFLVLGIGLLGMSIFALATAMIQIAATSRDGVKVMPIVQSRRA